MASKRSQNAALFQDKHEGNVVPVKSGYQKRVENIESEDVRNKHQPVVSNALKIKLDHMKTFSALTKNQQLFFDAYDRGDYFISLHGVAGSGKTFTAFYKAIAEVLRKDTTFEKIIVVRSAVPSREIGHLPGSLTEKLEIYSQPYAQICHTLFGRKDAWTRLGEQGAVEFISTSYIRGMSFDDSIIIVDELQNCTFEELDSVITRCGHRSKIIFVGDYRQTDLNKKRNDMSGIFKFFDIAESMTAFTKIEFTPDDIVRSSLVKDYIIAKMKYDDSMNV
jgi:phosphate starvation-inducible PhoH-like protein